MRDNRKVKEKENFFSHVFDEPCNFSFILSSLLCIETAEIPVRYIHVIHVYHYVQYTIRVGPQ